MKKIIIVVALAVLGLLSFFTGSELLSNPETYRGSIEVLNEKQSNVMALTAASAAASTALSAIPGDAGTPIANQVAEISTYLFLVTCIVFLEKFLITVIGYVVCRFVIPIACIIGIVALLKDYLHLKSLAIKLGLAGILCISVVPLSVSLTCLIEETNHIDMSSVEEELSSEDTKEDGGWLSIFDKVVENTTKLPEKAKEVVVKLVDNVAIMLVTSCIIPILVMISYFLIIKGIFKFDITPPPIKRVHHK